MLNYFWIKEKIEINDNKSTTYQNLWNMAKVITREKCVPFITNNTENKLTDKHSNY